MGFSLSSNFHLRNLRRKATYIRASDETRRIGKSFDVSNSTSQLIAVVQRVADSLSGESFSSLITRKGGRFQVNVSSSYWLTVPSDC